MFILYFSTLKTLTEVIQIMKEPQRSIGGVSADHLIMSFAVDATTQARTGKSLINLAKFNIIKYYKLALSLIFVIFTQCKIKTIIKLIMIFNYFYDSIRKT